MSTLGLGWPVTTSAGSRAHVRFGDLDFIVTTEGELAMAPAAVRPLHSAGLDAIAEALEELQLHAPEACAPESD